MQGIDSSSESFNSKANYGVTLGMLVIMALTFQRTVSRGLRC